MDLQFILGRLGLKKLPCPLIFDSKNLNLFEAGAFIQQQDRFWIELKKNSYLAYLGYDLQTILMHELIHAIRKDRPESIFEELIAYQVSKFPYQRLLGPFLSLKRGKLALILMTVFCNTAYLTECGVFIFIGLIGSLISFCSYLPSYFCLIKAKKILKQEGCDPLLGLIKLSKEQLIEKSSCFSIWNI